MLFSDLLADPEPILQSLHHLRHRGHEIILFHILDEAEVHFPFEGVVEFEDVEDNRKLTLDARSMRPDYVRSLEAFRGRYRTDCARGGHRLCADGHEHQLRQGADGVFAAAQTTRMSQASSPRASLRALGVMTPRARRLALGLEYS